jgi:hypothetical protein
MIDAKQAVKKAESYLFDFYPEARGVLLEEIDSTEDNNYWLITLSMVDPNAIENLLSPLLQMKARRYKVLQVSKETGDIRKMYIRNLD